MVKWELLSADLRMGVPLLAPPPVSVREHPLAMPMRTMASRPPQGGTHWVPGAMVSTPVAALPGSVRLQEIEMQKVLLR